MNPKVRGHLLGLFTGAVWGTTFVATKILMRELDPVEILFERFVLGYLTLWILAPRPLKGLSLKQEGLVALGGLTGVTLYYMGENIALETSTASSVGVIVSTAPFFCAIFSMIFLRGTKKAGFNFYLGFLIAMAGIVLINFDDGTFAFQMPGTLVAILASAFWGVYSIISKKVMSYHDNTILLTRRMFFFGILFMIPFLPAHFSSAPFTEPTVTLNLVFLGVVASALCFVTWNEATRLIGPVSTSLYIYMTPVITVILSAVVLKEPMTPTLIAGTALTILGLALSEFSPAEMIRRRKQKNGSRSGTSNRK